jgi:hypothetical protein
MRVSLWRLLEKRGPIDSDFAVPIDGRSTAKHRVYFSEMG